MENTDEVCRPTCKSRSKKTRKINKLSLVEHLKRLHVQENSDETEDGAETDSDFHLSCSFSEAGEDADNEASFISNIKKKLRRKTSTSSKTCTLSSDEDKLDSLRSPGLQYCQETTSVDFFLIQHLRLNPSPFKEERFEDQGTLADVEDCEESERSDREYGWKSNSAYKYKYWNRFYWEKL